MDNTPETLIARQQRALLNLNVELGTALATGDEYAAHLIRRDIVEASSLARLVHKAPKQCNSSMNWGRV